MSSQDVGWRVTKNNFFSFFSWVDTTWFDLPCHSFTKNIFKTRISSIIIEKFVCYSFVVVYIYIQWVNKGIKKSFGIIINSRIIIKMRGKVILLFLHVTLYKKKLNSSNEIYIKRSNIHEYEMSSCLNSSQKKRSKDGRKK